MRKIEWKGPYWEPKDAWVGCYWNRGVMWDIGINKAWETLEIYLCLIPFFPIKVTIRGKQGETSESVPLKGNNLEALKAFGWYRRDKHATDMIRVLRRKLKNVKKNGANENRRLKRRTAEAQSRMLDVVREREWSMQRLHNLESGLFRPPTVSEINLFGKKTQVCRNCGSQATPVQCHRADCWVKQALDSASSDGVTKHYPLTIVHIIRQRDAYRRRAEDGERQHVFAWEAYQRGLRKEPLQKEG